MYTKIRTILVEPEPVFHESLVNFINVSDRCICSGPFRSLEETKKPLRKLKPDVVIVNVICPVSRIDIISSIKTASPSSELMICIDQDDIESIFAAFRAGVNGCILRKTEFPKILESIIELHEGGSPMSSEIARILLSSFHKKTVLKNKLTGRESEILELLKKGFSYKEIAADLFISMNTVRSHVLHIYKKCK